MAEWHIPLVGPDIEAPQPIDQFLDDLADCGMTPMPIGIGQAIKQGRRRGGERHFKVHGQGGIIDSGHSLIKRTKVEL